MKPSVESFCVTHFDNKRLKYNFYCKINFSPVFMIWSNKKSENNWKFLSRKLFNFVCEIKQWKKFHCETRKETVTQRRNVLFQRESDIYYFNQETKFFCRKKIQENLFVFSSWTTFFSCLVWWETIFRRISLILRKQWKSNFLVWNSEIFFRRRKHS